MRSKTKRIDPKFVRGLWRSGNNRRTILAQIAFDFLRLLLFPKRVQRHDIGALALRLKVS